MKRLGWRFFLSRGDHGEGLGTSNVEIEQLTSRLSNMQEVREWMQERGGWKVFENRLAGRLEEELETAKRLAVGQMHVDDAGFDEIANQSNSRLNWVVTQSGDLFFSPKIVLGEEIAHTVLTRGGPVVAAGDAVIVADLDGPVCIEITNRSGHYRPDERSLLIGKKAFEAFGITFLGEESSKSDADPGGQGGYSGGYEGHDGGHGEGYHGEHGDGGGGGDGGHRGVHGGYHSDSDEDDKDGSSNAAAKKTVEELREQIKDNQDIIHQESRYELKNLLDRLEKDELTKIIEHHLKLQDVFDLIQDSNRDFRLSDINAVNALIGPPGTTVEVKGPGVQDADILFRDSSGEVIGSREVKCILGKAQKSFNEYVLYAGLRQVQVVSEEGAKEILLQLPEGTTEQEAKARLARMHGGDAVKKLTEEEVTKLQNVQITFVDPSGKTLFTSKVLP